MKRLAVLILTLVSLTATSAIAQPARGGRDGGRGGMNEAERQRALDWAKINMPHLYTLATTAPFRQRFSVVAGNHFRIFNSANIAGKEKLKSVYAAEDNIYGIVIKLERASLEEKPAIRQSIESELRALVQGNFDDRARRIEKLKKDLAEEEKKLANDQNSMDQIVRRRLSNQFGIDTASNGPTTAPSTRPSGDAISPAAADVLAAPAQ